MASMPRSVLLGSLLGASLGGSAGYFLTDKKKGRRQRIKNVLKAALAGGAAGGLSGGLLNTESNFRRISSSADRKRTPKDTPVPGRLYHVMFPENKYKEDGPFKGAPIQHSLIALQPKDERGNDNILTWSYASTDDTKENPGFATADLIEGVKGLPPKDVAKRLLAHTKGIWGNKIELRWVDVPDIMAAGRFSDAFMEDKLRGNYGIAPGQSNCGTFSRDMFEYTRKSRLGHFLDMLIGGRPGINAPSFGTNYVSYAPGQP